MCTCKKCLKSTASLFSNTFCKIQLSLINLMHFLCHLMGSRIVLKNVNDRTVQA